MKNLIVALASFCCVAAFGGTWYVVPGGTGDGSSWANGASLDSVLANVSDGDVVLLRQGVHSVSVAVTLTNVKLTMRGGYAAGDADDAPSGDKYSTIISADAALDNVWVSFDPETAAKTVVLEDGEPMKVIKDGALNLPPAYTAKYQVYYPAEVDEGGAITDPVGLVGSFVTFAGSASCDISNVTFSGFGDKISSGYADASILAWPDKKVLGNVESRVRQVAFVGNAAKGSLVGCTANNTANQPCGDFTDVEVKFCRLNEGSAIRFTNWVQPPSFTNCVFESLCGENALRALPIALDVGRKASVQGCAFRRLVHVSGENWSKTDNDFILNDYANSAALALNLGADTFFIRDCDVDCCWADNNRSTTLLQFNKYSNVRNLRVRENYVKMTCTRGVRASLGGIVNVASGGEPIFDNALFVSNRMVVATAVPPTYGALPTEILAAPVMVCGVKALFGDCIFADNSVDISAVGIDSVKISRSIMAVNMKALGAPSVDCVHCTFSGPAAGDDFVLTKSKAFEEFSATLRMACFDCIFWSSANGYAYAGATVDGRGLPADCLTLQRCIVKNAAKIPCGVNFVDCTADDPMLAYDPATGVVRPTVAVEGVREHPQVWYVTVWNNNTHNYTFRNGCDLSTTNMYLLTIQGNFANHIEALMSRRSSGGKYLVTDANATEKPDLLGQLRPVNRATVGAVQTDLPDGRILAAETHPAGAGAVTIGSQYAGTDGFAEVTASSVDPLYTFQKWVDENGETLSTSATYKCPSEKDYTRIRAVFGAPQAKWTFRVDPEKGAFANGETEIAMTLSPGDDAPAFPEVKVDPAWHQTGWDKAMPAAVGSADLEFNVTFIPYTKVVYFDTHATGANDGTSWEDAYTHLGVAMDNAGGNNSYVGEVRIRQGVHVLPKSQNPANRKFRNVRLIGGFTGNGAERSADRRLTVISGDTNGDDAYVDQHGETVGKVYENGAFIEFRPPTEEEGWWEQANGSDNSEQAVIFDDAVACTNARIECCTFSGFVSAQQKLIATGLSLNTVITNCDFIAINNVYSGAMGQIEMKAAGEVRDCRFLGITGAGLYLNALDSGALFLLNDVKFLYSTRNRGKSRMIPFINCNKGSVQAENLEVGHVTVCNYLDEGTATENKSASIIFMDTSGNAASKPCWIRNGYFHDISSPQNDRPTKLLTMEYCANAAILDNCVFENIEIGSEYKPAAANKNLDIIPIVAKTVTNCVFRNVSFAYTGAPEGAKYCALADIREGLYGTTFENCRLSSAMNMYSFLVMSRGITGQAFNAEYGEGTHFIGCSVTNTGTYASDGYGSVALLGARAVNMNSSSFRRIGPLEIRNCSVYAPNMASAFLVDDIGGVGGTASGIVDGLSVLGCRVEGGTVAAGILRVGRSGAGAQPPAAVFRNVTVAENTLVSTVTSAAVVYRPNFHLDVGWSTFCGNVAPSEFYVVGNWKLNLTSSVVTSDADGWVAQKSSGNAQAANGIVFANSYVKGVDETSPYFSGENAFTVEPLMTGVVRNRRQRCYGVYHTPQSPYAHQAELAGVYSDEAPVDAAGVARPPEGPVLLGAMQTTYAAPGLMLLVK